MVKTKKKQQKTDPCQGCDGLCCRYFALPIETPEDWDDYDDIRWYLCHEHISVFVNEGDWYLNVETKCRYLDGGSRCENYGMRPKICRIYRTEDCDRTGDDYQFELHFKNDKQMEEYMRMKFGKNVFEKLENRKKSKRTIKDRKTKS